MLVFAGTWPEEAKKKENRHHHKEKNQLQLQQNLILDSTNTAGWFCSVKEARKQDAV